MTLEPNGADLILAERRRQITEEGWTREHDDKHDSDELIRAACVYASPRVLYVKADGWGSETVTFMSIWPHDWDLKSETTRVNGRGLDREAVKKLNDLQTPSRIRDLVKAGALIAAEIDRLQRL